MFEKITKFASEIRDKQLFKILQTAVLASAILSAVFGMVITADWLIFGDRVYPNISFAGVDIGMKSYDEVDDIFRQQLVRLEEQGIDLVYEEQTWTVYPDQLDIGLNALTWRQYVLPYARSGNVIENMIDRIKLAIEPVDMLPLILLAGNENFGSFVEEIAQEVEVPKTNASLKWQDGKIVVTESKAGREIVQGALTSEIQHRLRTYSSEAIELALTEVQPDVVEADVEPLVQQAEAWAQKTVHLKYDLHDWEILSGELAAWIGTAFDEIEDLVFLTVNTQQGRNALETRAQNGFNQEPQDAEFEIADGKVVKFKASQDGFSIDSNQTLDNLDTALAADSTEASIALVTQEPDVKTEDVNDMNIVEKVGRGVSYFRGSSWSRMHNIQTAANKLNGTIVPPHTEFSYNDTLGDISLSTGYVTGLIISKGMTVEGVGGGVCQPSTTMFRAALDAGFPIVERYEHAYRVHYYEEGGPGYEHGKPGIDATVYAPSKDFRFLNDTDYYVLIQTTYDQASYRLVIDLYSKSIGRTVEVSEPVVYNVTKALPTVYIDRPDKPPDYLNQIDWAAGGADTSFTRTVTNADGTVIEETWTSHYKAWSAKYERGTMGLEETEEEGTDTQSQDTSI